MFCSRKLLFEQLTISVNGAVLKNNLQVCVSVSNAVCSCSVHPVHSHFHFFAKGGTIAIIAAIEKPDYFTGIVLIGPAVIPDPTMVTPVKVTLYSLLFFFKKKKKNLYFQI